MKNIAQSTLFLLQVYVLNAATHLYGLQWKWFAYTTGNEDVMKYAVEMEKMDVIKYVLSFDAIKQKYMSDNEALFRLMTVLNQNIEQKEIVQFVISALGINTAKVKELVAFRKIDVFKIMPFIN